MMNTSSTATARRLFPVCAAVFTMLVVANTSWGGWETLADGSNFSSQAAFEQAYGYNYAGGGITHNGDCIMDRSNVVVVSGEGVKLRCTRFSGASVNGTFYDYKSGTFYWHKLVVFDSNHPVWDISVTCQVPYVAGTWPAFWLTPTNDWNCESDIMESWGAEGIRHGTYGAPPGDPGNANSWAQGDTETYLSRSQQTARHTYRIVAFVVNTTDVEFHYFQDGVQIYHVTKSHFVSNPLWVIFDYETLRTENAGAGGTPVFTGPLWVTVQRINISDLNLTGVPAGRIPNGTCRLVSRRSRMEVNVQGAATDNGGKCVQYPIAGAANGLWLVNHLGNNVYCLLGRESGRALEVPGWSRAQGTQIDIRDYLGSKNQNWKVTAVSGGYYELANVASSQVLEVSGGSTVGDAVIDQWPWNGGNNQEWLFQSP